MSEYQYYEFLAVDRKLTPQDRTQLRRLSSRAEISETRFFNEYHFGDFRGDPREVMTTWFDLHLYWANWGQRRLMIRVPARCVEPSLLARIRKFESVAIVQSGPDVIIGIELHEMDYLQDPPTLEQFAALRESLLRGDMRLIELIWLVEVGFETIDDDEAEPANGIGPIDESAKVFAQFFEIDPDLIAAASERGSPPAEISEGEAKAVIATMSETNRLAFLQRFYESDPGAGRDLQRWVWEQIPRDVPAPAAPRTASELRVRALAIANERDLKNRKKAEAALRRAEAIAQQERRVRLADLRKRVDGAWAEVDGEIRRRNPKGYDRAVFLLGDLRALAEEQGNTADFERRVGALRTSHAGKGSFIARLNAL